MTKIEWTRGDDGSAGETWNPTTGCDKISPGCGLPRFDGDRTGGCYALAMAARLKAMGQEKYQKDGHPVTSGPGFGITVHSDTLTLPMRWRKPRRVFVNSMSDLWHARVSEAFVGSVWDTMAQTPRHTYQILTKRPERMRRILAKWEDAGWMWRRFDQMWCGPIPGPLPNVWLGTSIELDEYTRRADELRRTPAAIRFVSLEPLLGPLPSLDLEGIDWAIIGGESGPNCRPLDLGWVRELIAQCREAGTAVFVKQLGSILGAQLGAGGKGGDWDAWPEDLRIREFPVAAELAVTQ
jgi:protein gp37